MQIADSSQMGTMLVLYALQCKTHTATEEMKWISSFILTAYPVVEINLNCMTFIF